MNIENLSDKIKIVHNTNDSNTGKVLFFMPGTSGEALTSKYDHLVEECLKKDIDVVRMQSWQDIAELEEKNIRVIKKYTTSYLPQNPFPCSTIVLIQFL